MGSKGFIDKVRPRQNFKKLLSFHQIITREVKTQKSFYQKISDFMIKSNKMILFLPRPGQGLFLKILHKLYLKIGHNFGEFLLSHRLKVRLLMSDLQSCAAWLAHENPLELDHYANLGQIRKNR